MEVLDLKSDVGRPLNTMQFTRLNHKKIEFLQCTKTDSRVKPFTGEISIIETPHPDYAYTLDLLVPLAIQVMGLNDYWKEAHTIDLKLDWNYSDRNDRWECSIEKLKIARTSNPDELIVGRSIEFGGVVFDDIPPAILEVLDHLFDEAWLYWQGRKSAQLTLFEEAKSTRSKVRKAA